MFWRREEKFKLIPVLPKNYRCICLRAIELAADPKVTMDKQAITDFSEQGKLTQKGIRNCINFEIRDGNVGIVGFHDHPEEMWINEIIKILRDIVNNRVGSALRGQSLNRVNEGHPPTSEFMRVPACR